jgi:hypothetical protein
LHGCFSMPGTVFWFLLHSGHRSNLPLNHQCQSEADDSFPETADQIACRARPASAPTDDSVVKAMVGVRASRTFSSFHCFTFN